MEIRAGQWFHSLVVVGTAMTACGTSSTVGKSDAGGDGSPLVDGGKDSDGSGDATVSTQQDGAPATDASADAPDSADMTALCCSGGGGCKYDDAGVSVCANCCIYCGGCIS